MPAEDFQKLKTEYRIAHDSVVTEWNQALKDYYKQINSLHQTVLEKMESSIQLVDTNATLETFKETFKKDHEHSQNDSGRNETLDEQKLIYREKALKIRLGEMSVAQQGFVKDYRIAAEKKFMKNRLDDPVYQKVIKLIESFTALYNTASTPPAEKKFILDTVRRLDALATSHRLNENRKPKKESELHTEFSRKIGVAVDQRIVQLKKLEPESTPTPARKSAKALLMKASAVMKRLRKKQPAQTHILPQAEAAFREFKDQVKTTPSVSPTPTKTGS